MQTAAKSPYGTTAWYVILGISLCHMMNDVMQSLLSAIYPLLREEFSLDFWQIGLLTFSFQVTASVLQPVVGMVTDKRPMPYSLPFGMAISLVGLVFLGTAHSYSFLLTGAMLIGIGSSVFHPEASRVTRMASGGRFGTAQSLFQVGGNAGTAIGPLLAAFIVVPEGRESILWFTAMSFVGIVVLGRVSQWYAQVQRANAGKAMASRHLPLPRKRVVQAIVVLALLTFTKNFYTAGITSYYTFFLMERFAVSTQHAQLMLFLFLAAMAAGVVLGGPIGDRYGRLTVIWISILGVLPFTMLLPYANLFWTGVLSVLIGLIMASAFSAIVVFAQELVPGRVGMIAGIFFGLAFGMGGIGAAVLGIVADMKGIIYVYKICAWLPLIGLLTIFLPRRSELVAKGA